MSEIEHPKPLQATDLLGHLGQPILGKHQAFEFGLFPYRIRQTPKLPLPQAEL
jgi:hypothetical protein